MNGSSSSYLIVNLISFYGEDVIEIIVFILHSSYIFQPLYVAVYEPLKQAPTKEPEAFIPLDSGGLMRVK